MITHDSTKYHFAQPITVAEAEIIGTILSWGAIPLEWLPGGVGLALASVAPEKTLWEELCKLKAALCMLGETETARRVG